MATTEASAPARHLTELTLDPPNATSGRARANTLDEDYTILSTVHSAKVPWGESFSPVSATTSSFSS